MTKDTLIDTTKPSMHGDMDFPTYLGDPADMPSMSSSIARSLLTTAPKRVWTETKRLNPTAEDKNKRIFDLGSAAHAELIGMGEKIVIIHHDSFRKADAKAERDAAYKAGHTPILAAEMDRITEMAEAGRMQFAQNPDIGFVFADERPSGTYSEASIFWRELNAACRCRPDLLVLQASGAPIIIHYKTTATAITPFSSSMARFAANQGWDLIAAHYHEGVKALTGYDPRQFFAVQETEPPYLTEVFELDNAFVANAAMRRDRALSVWSRCLATNTWPGHFNRTVVLAPPPWHENAQIAEKDAEQAIVTAEGKDPLDLALHWQAPPGWREE